MGFTDIFALEAKQKTSSRKITAHTLDRFIRGRSVQDMPLIDAVSEFILEDISIHGLSDRDKYQLKDELDSVFEGFNEFIQKVVKYLSNYYQNPTEPVLLFRNFSIELIGKRLVAWPGCQC